MVITTGEEMKNYLIRFFYPYFSSIVMEGKFRGQLVSNNTEYKFTSETELRSIISSFAGIYTDKLMEIINHVDTMFQATNVIPPTTITFPPGSRNFRPFRATDGDTIIEGTWGKDTFRHVPFKTNNPRIFDRSLDINKLNDIINNMKMALGEYTDTFRMWIHSNLLYRRTPTDDSSSVFGKKNTNIRSTALDIWLISLCHMLMNGPREQGGDEGVIVMRNSAHSNYEKSAEAERQKIKILTKSLTSRTNVGIRILCIEDGPAIPVTPCAFFVTKQFSDYVPEFLAYFILENLNATDSWENFRRAVLQ